MVEDLNLGDPEQTQPAVRVRLKRSASGLEVQYFDCLVRVPTVCQCFFCRKRFKIVHS